MRKFYVFILALSVIFISVLAVSCDTPSDTSAPADESKEVSKTEIVVPPEKSEPVDDGKVTYTVTVVDESGNPIEGIIIQFCDDQNCKLPVATDANGTVTATYAEGEYHITITDAKGYAGTGDTHEFEDGETELTITLATE